MQRNASDYEDQQAIVFNFTIRLSARVMRAGDLFMREPPPEWRTPIRQAGIERMRKGSAETIFGALVTMAQGVKPAYDQLVVGVLNDTGKVWATLLIPERRAQIIREIAAAQKRVTDSVAQNDLAMFAAILAAAKWPAVSDTRPSSPT